MNLLSTIFWIFSIRSIGGIIFSIWAYRYFRYVADMGISENGNVLVDDRRIIIIMPVLNEVNVISDTVERFIKLITPHNNIDLIIVGSITERNENEMNPTLKAAILAVRENPRVHIIEAPQKPPRRAHQINYAMHWLSYDPTKTWLLQVDVDSRISKIALDEIIQAVNAGHRVIQQCALFLVNFQRMTLIQRGQALFQSRWTLSHEFKRLMLSHYNLWSYYHVVGHGLCINADLLNSYGGMPTAAIVEDMELGYYLCCDNERVHIIHNMELADSPSTFKSGQHQLYRWAFGQMNCLGYFRQYLLLKEGNLLSWKHRIKAFLLAVIGVISSMAWNTMSYLIALALWQITVLNWSVAIFLLCYTTEFIICMLFFRKTKLIGTRELIKASPFIVLHLLVRSFSANRAFFTWVTRRSANTQKADHE